MPRKVQLSIRSMAQTSSIQKAHLSIRQSKSFLLGFLQDVRKIIKECYSDPDGSVWCQLKDDWYSADDQSLLLVCNESEQEPLDEMCAAYLVSKDVYKLDDEGFKNWLH